MSQTKQVTLYSYSGDKLITLTEAISNCQDVLEGAICLLYSPNTCQVLRLTNQKFQNRDGEVNQLSDVFEARIFTEHCELRWLNQDIGKGQAVLLSDSKQSLKGVSLLNPKSCEFLDQKYLLWGKPAKNQPENTEWQRLAEARIGKLDIPFNQRLKDDQRIYLKTREYFAILDDYGNVAVVEERLVNLEAG